MPPVWAGPSRAERTHRDRKNLYGGLPVAAFLGAWPGVPGDRVVDEGLVSDDADADGRLSRLAITNIIACRQRRRQSCLRGPRDSKPPMSEGEIALRRAEIATGFAWGAFTTTVSAAQMMGMPTMFGHETPARRRTTARRWISTSLTPVPAAGHTALRPGPTGAPSGPRDAARPRHAARPSGS